jgi:predicted amidophosphoribosyltransferase
MRKLLRLFGLTQGNCLNCEKPAVREEFLCEDCFKELKPQHPMEYTYIPYVFSYRVFGRYEGAIKSLILNAKFENNPYTARFLGKVVKDYLWQYINEIQPDIITFPELNLRRLWLRGFNQVEEILNGADVPYQRIFKRKGFDPPMARLGSQERLKAVQSHQVKKHWLYALEDKKILVVDDVLTTGQTISHLCQMLLSLGAKETHAFFIAQSV